MVWGSIIAWYLFLAGVGAGAFITSWLASRYAPQAVYTRKAGRLLAPVVVIIGLLLLIIDARGGLFHPQRFLLLIANLHSVMSWGVIFLSIFVVIALFVAAMEWIDFPVPRVLELVGVIFALAVAGYTGVLLAVSPTFPLWNNAMLPVLFTVSALSTGASAAFIAPLIARRHEFDMMMPLHKAHAALPVIEVFLVAALMFITYYTNSAGHKSVISLLCGRYAIAFWLGFVLLGLAIPLVVELRHVVHASQISTCDGEEHTTSSGGLNLALFACVTALIGGFLLRYLIIVSALPLDIVVK